MLDTVHTTLPSFIAVFRCDFCLEIVPTSGTQDVVYGSHVYLVTLDSANSLKHYDYLESLDMKWIVCCHECDGTQDISKYVESLSRRSAILRSFNIGRNNTISLLQKLKNDWDLSSYLKVELNKITHLTERPDV